MTKAELEWQFNQFTSYAQQCDSYHRAGAFFGSLDSASVSLSFADGMLQYSKRFGAGPPRSVGTVDYIIYYAPLLFHRVSLQRLEDSISASRRLAKGETWDYSGAVSAALKRMELARKLWNILDERGELEHRQVTAIFGSAGQSVQHIVKVWTLAVTGVGSRASCSAETGSAGIFCSVRTRRRNWAGGHVSFVHASFVDR
jgi:hypothetical protein